MTTEEYNALVEAGRIINQPVGDNTAEVITTKIHEEDQVSIFRIHNAIALYWADCGHLYSVYVK